MKKNLEILESENKVTNAEPPVIYTRFKTNEGWMSCFNKKANEELKKRVGAVACVETSESPSKDGSRMWQNITECYGAPQEGASGVDLKVGEEPVPVVKPGELKGNVTSDDKGYQQFRTPKEMIMCEMMSDTKDVFICLSEIENKSGEPTSKIDDVIKQSIEVVETFKKAFE